MSEQQSSAVLLAEIVKQLKAINSKLDQLLQVSSSSNVESNFPEIDVMTLLTLPASHRKTVMAL